MPTRSGCLVCVFGISGVGKTTLIRQFVGRHPDWLALSASGLLAELIESTTTSLRTAERPVIEQNQSSIAEAIQRHRRRSPQAKWILDAHSAIDNGQEIVVVPNEVIVGLEPDGLVFICDDATSIRRRRTMDLRRQRPMKSVHEIEKEQRIALEACIEYAKKLELELHQIGSQNLVELETAIEKTEKRETEGWKKRHGMIGYRES